MDEEYYVKVKQRLYSLLWYLYIDRYIHVWLLIQCSSVIITSRKMHLYVEENQGAGIQTD